MYCTVNRNVYILCATRERSEKKLIPVAAHRSPFHISNYTDRMPIDYDRRQASLTFVYT